MATKVATAPNAWWRDPDDTVPPSLETRLRWWALWNLDTRLLLERSGPIEPAQELKPEPEPVKQARPWNQADHRRFRTACAERWKKDRP